MELMPHRKKRKTVTEPWYIFRQKAVWSRQKTVTAELKSRGMMYRKELVSKTGTRLS